jgi:purine-binding chemotaxis protein CheW
MAYEQKTKSFSKTSFSSNSSGNQYLQFSIEDDYFAVPVEMVNQIEFYEFSRKVPGSQDFVLGITKSRGKIITLIHLASRLKIHNKPPVVGENHIIYLEKGSKIVGILVDKVSNIITINKNLIKDVDTINSDIPIDFLKGIATINDRIVVMLNIDLVLSNFVVEEIKFKSEKFKRDLGDGISKTGQITYDDFEANSEFKEDNYDDDSYETDKSLTDELYDTEEEDESEESTNFN